MADLRAEIRSLMRWIWQARQLLTNHQPKLTKLRLNLSSSPWLIALLSTRCYWPRPWAKDVRQRAPLAAQHAHLRAEVTHTRCTMALPSDPLGTRLKASIIQSSSQSEHNSSKRRDTPGFAPAHMQGLLGKPHEPRVALRRQYNMRTTSIQQTDDDSSTTCMTPPPLTLPHTGRAGG